MAFITTAGFYPYDQTTRTYTIPFYDRQIHTTVTKNPDHVTAWIFQTEQVFNPKLHRIIVGLDVEWRPFFTPGVENPVAILQICIGSRCLIFQILHSPRIPFSLFKFLNNPSYCFTGVGIQDDISKLIKNYELGVKSKMVDLRSLAAKVYNDARYAGTGLKSLTSLVLRKYVDKQKHITLSLWDSYELSYEQIEHACLDAHVSFEIARVLFAMQKQKV